VWVPQLAAQDSSQAQVLATDDRRFAAMIRADTAALRSILAPDLAYTHTTGEKQDRTEFLHTLASGELRYKSIIPIERTVRLLGAEVAAVIGRSNMQVEAGGQVRAFTIRYVAVYQHSPEGWQLVVWQSTRLPS
jgi:ketosteroid isomerase-like protein